MKTARKALYKKDLLVYLNDYHNKHGVNYADLDRDGFLKEIKNLTGTMNESKYEKLAKVIASHTSVTCDMAHIRTVLESLTFYWPVGW